MSKSRARTEAALTVKGESKLWGRPEAFFQEGLRIRLQEGQGPNGSFRALWLRILFLGVEWSIIPSLVPLRLLKSLNPCSEEN